MGRTVRAQPRGVDPDRGPWAAYVVGHHPSSLTVWHTRYVYPERNPRGDQPGLFRGRIARELLEVDMALEILTRSGKVAAAALNSFRQERELFATIHREHINVEKEIFYEPKVPLGSVDCDSGVSALDELDSHSRRLLEKTDYLLPFLELGRWLGNSQVRLRDEDPWERGDAEDWEWELEHLQDLIWWLPGSDDSLGSDRFEAFLENVCDLVNDPPDGSCERLALRLDQLDRYLRLKLRHWKGPAPVLELDHDHLLIHGRRVEYNRHNRTYVALLWTLAEHLVDEGRIAAGRPKSLARSDIIQRSRISASPHRLPEPISRLRREVIEPATREFFRVAKLPVPVWASPL
jgi:hypothetical protein